MEVQPKNPTAKGSAERFTGDVWIDAIAQAHGPSPMTVDHLMTHLSMSEGEAEWGEHIGNSEYRGQG